MLDVAIFVVNLKRDTDRRCHMTKVLGSLGLAPEFIPAVDGRTLSAADRACCDRSRSSRIYGVDMLDTEIACYLSHYRLYERMIREEIEMALILEDDVRIEPTFPDILQDLLACRHIDWLVIRLDSKRTRVHDPPSAKFRGVCVAELSGSAGLYRLRTHVLGTGAYLIRCRGAARMIEYGRRIFMPIDQTMDRYWENGILPYVVRPFPVLQKEDFGSSTGVRPPYRRSSQPSPVRMRRRVQRASEGVRKRIFNFLHT